MRRRLKWTLALSSAFGVAGAIVWLYRTPLVTNYVDRTLSERGVQASYRFDQIGFRTQKLSNVVIGDPRNPDLTARELIVDVTLDWDGPHISRLVARGVRVKGRWTGDRLSFGQLDRLKPADDGTPFELPDMTVSLADVAARIETPWGAAGVAAAGAGHLRDGFDGRIAVRAPRMQRDDCSVIDVTGDVRLRILGREPQLTGPVGVDRLACAKQGVQLADLRLGIKASVREDLGAWRVDSGLRSDRIALGQLSGGGTSGQIGVRGQDDGRIAADWRLTARDARSPWLQAASLSIEGRGGMAASGAVAANGEVQLAGGKAGGDALRRFNSLARTGQGTPVGPLLAKAGDALSRAGRSLSMRSAYEFEQAADAPVRFSLGDVAVSSATGASLHMSGERAIGWDAVRGLSLATRLRFGGGGLPGGEVELARPGAGAALTGRATFAPYQAGDAVLALAPTRFSAAPDGSASFATGLALSGPLAGGRIERLTLPLAGRIGRDGTLAISGECRSIGWQAIRAGGVELDPGRIRLCGQSGAPLLSLGPAGLRGGATLPALRLSGRAGDSPLRLASSGGTVRLADSGFELRGIEALLGGNESPIRFSAARLTGAARAGGLSGRMEQAEAQIGPVPFLLSEASGDWALAAGRLTLRSALRVTDAAADDRFNPLRAEAVDLSMADGVITASGLLKEERSGAPVADLTIRHQLADAAGQARFTLPNMRFSPDGLQPRDVTPLAFGVIANADGLVTGQGEVNWDSQGIRSQGDFATDRLDFAAAFGPVQRLSGRMHFDDLIALSTPPHQEVLLGSVNPGIEVTDGRLLYQLIPGQQVRIEGGRWPFAGGELRLQPTVLDFSAEVARRLTFDVSNVDAALFLQRFEFENISATGIFDGVLPTVFDQDGGRVEGGTLVSRSGGSLAYVGELSTRDLGTYANLAFGALKSLRYNSLAIRMNGAIDGEMLTEVDFTGLSQGEGATRNFLTRAVESLPFTFSIRINAPFRQLLTSARGLYDPTTLIEQNLPALVQAERDAAARAAATAQGVPAAPPAPLPNPAPVPNIPGEARPAAVQPRESEDRP